MNADALDDLFQGCALAAYLEQAAREQWWPDQETTRRIAYRLYEEALAEKNGRFDTSRDSRYARPMKHDIDISQLSPAECILLAEQLWERVSRHPEHVPVPQEHLDELRRRLDAIESGQMEPGEPWAVVRERLWPR